MHRSLLPVLFVAAFLLVQQSLIAQPGHFPFKGAGDSLAAVDLVKRYLRFTVGDPMPVDSIEHYAVEEFYTWLDKNHGVPIRFPDRMPYDISGVRSVRADGDLVQVTLAAHADSIPMFGSLTIEWVFFVRSLEGKGWRISGLRRQNGIEDVVEELRFLDTSSLYPKMLKPIIARESSRSLLSNAQLRSNFVEHRAAFNTLAGFFHQKDSLWMLGRIDRAVTQLNQYGIDWGDGAQEVPKEAIEEVLAKLEPDQQQEMKARLRAAESARRMGRDTLQRMAKRLGIKLSKVDSAVGMMRDLRVSFINARLPWKRAVQFTVGGRQMDVHGYLYSPNGELPWVSLEEYFYLEDLGDGWWIFRST